MHALSWLRGVVYCVCHGSAQPELSLSLAQPIPPRPPGAGDGRLRECTDRRLSFRGGTESDLHARVANERGLPDVERWL